MFLILKTLTLVFEIFAVPDFSEESISGVFIHTFDAIDNEVKVNVVKVKDANNNPLIIFLFMTGLLFLIDMFGYWLLVVNR